MRHLLIDEFQDTSITQFELIERLVADWSSGDGRTLFVVGDRCRSIYRFREAEVGLFLRAWERGVGPLVLEPLRLTRNFRSQGRCRMVNDAFARVLPRESDIASGAVSFEPAAAVRGRTLDDAVQVHAFVGGGAADEAKRVVEVVEAIRAESPQASIALLVRARSPPSSRSAAELRQAGLCPTAVELHSLANQPLIRTSLPLTRALEHLADRTAWLSVLRAPWCGLTLADLASLAEGDSRLSVELLEDDARLHRLSADRVAPAVARVDRSCSAPSNSPAACRAPTGSSRPGCCWADRRCTVIRIRARGCGAVLRAPCSPHEDENGGRIEVHDLQESARIVGSRSQAGSDPAFHVTTIHKAKGLEFDGRDRSAALARSRAATTR